MSAMAHRNSKTSLIFITLLLAASQASCGNQELMEKARQKVFLLNKEILEQTDELHEGNVIEFSGRVKRTPDGRLQFTIDELNQPGSDGDSAKGLTNFLSPPQDKPAIRSKPPTNNQTNHYIRYVLFEDMIESSASGNSTTESNFEGGGKALSE